MNLWDTTERFGVVVLNESLYYSENPRDLFERAVSWLSEEGVVIVSIFRQLAGSRRVWSQVEAVPTKPLAACSVTGDTTGYTWDIRVMPTPRLSSNRGPWTCTGSTTAPTGTGESAP